MGAPDSKTHQAPALRTLGRDELNASYRLGFAGTADAEDGHGRDRPTESCPLLPLLGNGQVTMLSWVWVKLKCCDTHTTANTEDCGLS